MKKTRKITLALLATTTMVSAHGQESWMTPFFTTTAPTSYTTHISKPSGTTKPKISQSLQFIMDNREELALEVAKGEGERLDTIATLYKGIDKKNKDAWKLRLQENYEKIFSIDGVVTSDEYVDYMFRRLIDPME